VRNKITSNSIIGDFPGRYNPSLRRYISGVVGDFTVYQLFLSTTAAIVDLASFSLHA
jgi:hypothetical protein